MSGICFLVIAVVLAAQCLPGGSRRAEAQQPPLDTEGAKYGQGCVGSPYPGTPAQRCTTCCNKIKDAFTTERIFDLKGCIGACTVKATPPLDKEGPKYGEGCAGSPYPGTPAERCSTCCGKIRDAFTTERIFDLEGCKRGCVAKASRLSAAQEDADAGLKTVVEPDPLVDHAGRPITFPPPGTPVDHAGNPIPAE